MPADPNRVRDVFLAAVELPPDQRPAYLAEACRGDADLRAEVDRLLAANADPDSILEPPSPTNGRHRGVRSQPSRDRRTPGRNAAPPRSTRTRRDRRRWQPRPDGARRRSTNPISMPPRRRKRAPAPLVQPGSRRAKGSAPSSPAGTRWSR